MTTYNWKITEITAKDEVILSAKYHITATDENNSVETEGYWYFDCPSNKIPFNEVTEDIIAKWIESEAVRDDKCHITAQLDKQLDALNIKTDAVLPWLPQVFTPSA